MCHFASFVLTKDRELWCASDKHEDIIVEHNLGALDGAVPGLVRIEILPSENRRDLSTWEYKVDQDVFPEWSFDGDPELERRARAALERRAAKEKWFAEVIAPQATAGYAGTATAGDDGTATAGARGTATAGARGTATAGDDGTATVGARGTATAGYAGTATAGYAGTATVGARGTATAGDDGTATAGARGTATAGARGTATAGYAGTATAGDDGTLNIRWWDGKRYRIATFYVGESGIEPNTPYGVDGKGQPVKRERLP